MHPTHRRTLSSADPNSAGKIQDFLIKLLESIKNKIPFLNKDACKSTMVIPQQYTNKILSVCCAMEILRLLEQQKVINWFSFTKTLVPMHCENDGNSLLHAVSLYVFGVHDRKLVLRNMVYQLLFMENPKYGELLRRWECDHSNLLKQIYSSKNSFYPEESQKTWNHMIFTCSTEPGEKKKYNDLEPVHIFAISNILGRPIVVVTNTLCASTDMQVVQGLRYEGIYLPILRPPSECEKSPIILAYECNQFVSLFSTEKDAMLTGNTQISDTAQHGVSLQKYDSSELPIRYLFEAEKTKKVEYLRTYMETFSAPYKGQQMLEVAVIKFKAPSAHAIELLWAYQEKSVSNTRNYEQYPPIHQNIPTHQMQQVRAATPSYTPAPSWRFPSPNHQQHPQQEPPPQPPPPEQNKEIAYQAIDEEEQHQYALTSEMLVNNLPLKLCERSKAGHCNNTASVHNNQGYCDQCYEEYQKVRQQTRKRTDVPRQRQQHQQPQQQQYQQQQQQRQHYPPKGYNPPQQQYVPQVDFQYSKVMQPSQQQQQFASNISQPQKTHCISCVKNEGFPILNNMCKSCYDRHLVQTYEAEKQSLMPDDNDDGSYEMMHSAPSHKAEEIYESMKIPKSKFEEEFVCSGCDKKVYERKDDFGLCAECREKLKKKQHDMEDKKSLEEKENDEAMIRNTRESMAAGYSGHGELMASGNDVYRYDRTKVYCSYAGCGDRICAGSERFCEKHSTKKSTEKCVICKKNGAEDNGVCITCFQSQSNLLDEVKAERKAEMEAPRQTENFNIGRGPVGGNRPYSDGSFPNMDDIMGNLPPLPNPSSTPVAAPSPNSQMLEPHLQQPPHQNPNQFIPPTLYQGYVPIKNPHGGELNWQKYNVQSKKCIYCSNAADPSKQGLCDGCSKLKNLQNQPYAVAISPPPSAHAQRTELLQPCVNEGCNNPGRVENNFLCDKCYAEQVQKYQSQQPQQPSQTPNVGCATRGCVKMAAPPSKLCHDCLDGNYPDFQPQPIQHPVPTSPPAAEMSGPNQMQEKAYCESLDCDFYGSPEFGGYCSSCFMDITKREAEVKKQVGIQSYIPEEQPPAGPNNELNGRGPVNSGNAPGYPHNLNPYVTAQYSPRAIGFAMNPVRIGLGINKEPGVRCKNPSCTMYGNEEWGGLCSSCFRANLVERDGGGP